jgi:release factor glutamine methyltransferase
LALHDQIVGAITNLLRSNEVHAEIQEFRRLLKANPCADPLAAVLEPELAKALFVHVPGGSVDGWIMGLEDWKGVLFDPRRSESRDAASNVLLAIWEHISSQLLESLRKARDAADIPPSGGVLAFGAHLTKCLVLTYEFTGRSSVPKLSPVAIIDAPRSAFDFWRMIDLASPRARNELKRILATGHKLIFHRGVLVHVDRSRDVGVFGPSIDTIVLSELLATELYEQEWRFNRPVRALEIGSGSGFLGASLVRHLPELSELVCVDIELTAVACTDKNLRIAGLLREGQQPKTRVERGEFSSDESRIFDLVVCNPPYIPLPSKAIRSSSVVPDFAAAVGGVELLEAVVAVAPSILSPGGRLLVMTSSLTPSRFVNELAQKGRVIRPYGSSGWEALFDVESVWNNKVWFDFLRDKGMYERQEEWCHKLHPAWFTNS